MDKIAPYWKAVIGFVAPAMSVVLLSVLDASDGGSRITSSEWITAGATAVITAAGVYTVPNKVKRRAPVKKSIADDDPPEHRATGPAI